MGRGHHLEDLTEVETVLAGRYYFKDGSLTLSAELLRASTGQVLRRETVTGPGLERLFDGPVTPNATLRFIPTGIVQAVRAALTDRTIQRTVDCL